MKDKDKLKEGDKVITPSGNGEVFEVSYELGFVSVFVEGIRKAQIFELSHVQKTI